MGTPSKRSILSLFAAAALAVLSPAWAATDAESARSANEKSSRDVLQRLFAACPGAKAELRASEGYATFAGVGTGSTGSGVARPTRTRTPAYIAFSSAEAAAGTGKRDLVFIFSTREDFSNFAVKGASLGGKAEAAPSGSCSQALSPGVRVIQLEGKKVVGGDVPSAQYSKASLN